MSLFSSYRASRILGIKVRSLRTLINRGFIPATRTRGQWHFHPADVFAFKKWGPPFQRTSTAARVIGVHPRTLTAWADAGLVLSVRDSYGHRTNPQHQRIYERYHVIEIAELRREHGRRLVGILEERAEAGDRSPQSPDEP
jgi:DNA-binding transcriptional MerR regulator